MKKKRIFKAVTTLMVCGLFFFFLSGTVRAEGEGSFDVGDDIQDILNGQMDATGADELFQAMPTETERYLSELGIDEVNIANILQLDTGQVFDLLVTMVKDYFQSMGGTFLAIIGIILIAVLMDVLKDNFTGTTLTGVFNLISVLCLIAVVITPVINTLYKAVQAVQNETIFITALIPVLAGVMAAGGQILTGATYNLLLYGLAQLISVLVSTVVVPLISIYLAFCLASSVSPNLNLEQSAKGIKTAASWILGLSVTVFSAVLTTQTIVTSSADSVTAKAGKFLIGSAIPVVGGPLSDAVATIQGCLGLLKNVVGVFGIIVALLIFLPVLLECIMWIAILNVSAFVSDIFSVKTVGNLLRSVSGALSLLSAVLVASGFLVVVSTTIVLLVGGKSV